MQGSLDGYTQSARPSIVRDSTKYDTLRASLLLTRKKMTMAYNYEGHAVLDYRGRITEFLDDRKRRFRKEVTVWQYRIRNNF